MTNSTRLCNGGISTLNISINNILHATKHVEQLTKISPKNKVFPGQTLFVTQKKALLQLFQRLGIKPPENVECHFFFLITDAVNYDCCCCQSPGCHTGRPASCINCVPQPAAKAYKAGSAARSGRSLERLTIHCNLFLSKRHQKSEDKDATPQKKFDEPIHCFAPRRWF